MVMFQLHLATPGQLPPDFVARVIEQLVLPAVRVPTVQSSPGA
jgi:hypothetical protein